MGETEPGAKGAQATRQRLLGAALDVMLSDGLAAASARTIATRAGVNQGLIFYHFGTVADLVEAASGGAVDACLAELRPALDAVSSVDALVAAASPCDGPAARGVRVTAQLLAGAGSDPVVARAARRGLDAWASALSPVLRRLQGSTQSDADALARAVVAALLGLSLSATVDADGAASALAALGAALAGRAQPPRVAQKGFSRGAR